MGSMKGLGFTLVIVASLGLKVAIASSNKLETDVKPTQTEIALLAVTSDAKEFARFDDEFPLVVNYFSQQSKAQIRDFYQAQFGQIQSEQSKRGRLQLNFLTANNHIRVIISQQNNARQVDVIIEPEHHK